MQYFSFCRCWLGLLLSPLLLNCGTRSDDDGSALVAATDTPQLILELEHTVDLPADFDVAGATLTGDGSVVAWSRQHARLLRFAVVDSPAKIEVIALPDSSRIVYVHAPNAAVLQVVDAYRREIRTLEISGRVGWSKCSIPISNIWDATRGPAGSWYVAGFDTIGRTQIAVSDRRGCAPWHIRTLEAKKIGTLSKSSRGVWFAYRDPSQGIDVLGDDGLTTRQMVPNAAELSQLRTGVDSTVSWTAMKNVDLGDASLQVLSDLKSERRRLLLRSGRGRLQRVSDIKGMWSVFDGDETQHRIAAFHELSGTQILLYGWRWQLHSKNNSP